MMKRIYNILFFVVCINTFLSAQTPKEKALRSITQNAAKSVITFLASDVLEGRGAGKQGGRVASEYLASYLMGLGIEPFLSGSFFQPFEAYSEDFQKKKRYTVDPDSIQKYRKGVHRVLRLRNVLGMIPGKNEHQYIIVAAHFDHLGIDENLEGDKIYNGADDNASGVSAVMQIAKAFVESGIKPQRNVIFAFWDGEENGLLGSEYFAQHCPFIDNIDGYLNFDMIGRNTDDTKPDYVVYFYSDSHPIFKNWLQDDIKRHNLDLSPDYRASDSQLGGSDNRTFGKRNIPIIWYHTDGHADYHQPSDTSDKINWNKLTDITKAAFLNAWNLANELNY